MENYNIFNELLKYDPDSGKIFWRRDGSEAGNEYKKPSGLAYRQILVHGSQYLAHRLAWLLATGSFPKNQIDHINGDGLDNRLSNLREATNRENSRNRPISVTNKSGVVGVSWNKKSHKWEARINDNDGCRKYLGEFDSIEGAARARRAAERKYGYHPNHGRVTTRERSPYIPKHPPIARTYSRDIRARREERAAWWRAHSI